MEIKHILKVIEKLPHSKNRVPYTYHHDYIRTHSPKYVNMSRAEIANMIKSSGLELYAVALTQLLEELGVSVIYYLSEDDILVCKKAKAITDELVSKIL